MINFLDGGNFDKFLVLKWDDINRYLTRRDKDDLNECIEAVLDGRRMGGKPDNTYLVINTDEPYAHEIVEILKRNGHWG